MPNSALKLCQSPQLCIYLPSGPRLPSRATSAIPDPNPGLLTPNLKTLTSGGAPAGANFVWENAFAEFDKAAP